MMRSKEDTGSALETIKSSQNLLITGPPGSGKTRALISAFHALVEDESPSAWSPVLLLTPDRRRANRLEGQLEPGLLGRVWAPGGHRLVRGVNSFAYQVISQWLVERRDPKPRPTLTGGADEDVWFAGWLRENAANWGHIFPEAAGAGEDLRMELRNGIARAGERGIGPLALGEIGRRAGVPAWEMLSAAYMEYAGTEDAVFTADTRHVDSARIQVIAAQTLRDWDRLAETEGVSGVAPVPGTVLVDDLQDCTPATVHLLSALAERGAQIVATASLASGTSAYRGGGSSTANLLTETLHPNHLQLARVYRGGQQSKAIVEAASRWVMPSLPAPAFQDLTPLSPTVISGSGRRGAWIAQQIRRYHFLEGVPWKEQAVIVRSASDIEPLRRQLQRADVPLAPTERSLQFNQVPVTRTLLELLASDDSDDAGDAAMRLLASPLVNVDNLALYRFLRTRGSPEKDYERQLLDWLETPPEPGQDHAGPSALRIQEQLQRANRIWKLRGKAGDLTPQLGLWQLWDAAEVADTWQKQVLHGGSDAARADDRLDAVLALFRRADLWEQQAIESGHSTITGRELARELLAQTVASDSIAQAGLREPGVEILTVSQAAGRQWDAVYVVGLQDGAWPARAQAGGILHLARLEQLLQYTSLPELGAANLWLDDLDPQLLRAQLDECGYRLRRRREEASLFVAAASRSSRFLHLVAVENDAEAASPFLNYLTAQSVLANFRDSEGDPILTRVPPALDLSSLAAQLRRRTVSPLVSADQRQLAAMLLAGMADTGVETADPATWVGAGGISSDSPLIQEGEELRLGPSSLQTGADCALQWFFRAVHGENRPGILRPMEVGPAEIGNLIHSVAELHPDGDEAALRDAFNRQWEALGLDERKWWVQRQKADLEAMVDVLGRHFRATQQRVLVEQPIRTKLGPILLSGRVDRIEFLPDNSVRVVDIKTGKSAPSAAKLENNMQLSAYQLALREKYNIDSAALLLVRPSAGKKRPLRSQEALSDESADALQAELSALGQNLLGPKYSVHQVQACASCRFKAVCPVQDEGIRSVP